MKHSFFCGKLSTKQAGSPQRSNCSVNWQLWKWTSACMLPVTSQVSRENLIWSGNWAGNLRTTLYGSNCKEGNIVQQHLEVIPKHL